MPAERIKGVGTGLRWLDKAAIGYPVISLRADLTPLPAGGPALPSDSRVSDVRHPFFGSDEMRYDGWVSDRRRILVSPEARFPRGTTTGCLAH